MTQPKKNRSDISKLNKGRADDLERFLIQQNEYLRALGIADVEKVPDPVKITRRVYAQNGPKKTLKHIEGRLELTKNVDFKGVVQGGRAIMFEAKCTDKDRFDFSTLNNKTASKKKIRTQHQMLTDAAKMGSHCFVYVRHFDDYRFTDYLFPVDADGVIAGVVDKKSINFKKGEATHFKVAPGQYWSDKFRELYSASRVEDETPAAAVVELLPETTVIDEDAPPVDRVNRNATARRLRSTQ